MKDQHFHFELADGSKLEIKDHFYVPRVGETVMMSVTGTDQVAWDVEDVETHVIGGSMKDVIVRLRAQGK